MVEINEVEKKVKQVLLDFFDVGSSESQIFTISEDDVGLIVQAVSESLQKGLNRNKCSKEKD